MKLYMTNEMRDILDKIAELEIEFRKLEVEVHSVPRDISGWLIQRELEAA